MNARTLPHDLQRTAAQARMRSAKDAFTRLSVDVLHGRAGAADRVPSVLAELTDARAELAALHESQS